MCREFHVNLSIGQQIQYQQNIWYWSFHSCTFRCAIVLWLPKNDGSSFANRRRSLLYVGPANSSQALPEVWAGVHTTPSSERGDQQRLVSWYLFSTSGGHFWVGTHDSDVAWRNKPHSQGFSSKIEALFALHSSGREQKCFSFTIISVSVI